MRVPMRGGGAVRFLHPPQQPVAALRELLHLRPHRLERGLGRGLRRELGCKLLAATGRGGGGGGADDAAARAERGDVRREGGERSGHARTRGEHAIELRDQAALVGLGLG